MSSRIHYLPLRSFLDMITPTSSLAELRTSKDYIGNHSCSAPQRSAPRSPLPQTNWLVKRIERNCTAAWHIYRSSAGITVEDEDTLKVIAQKVSGTAIVAVATWSRKIHANTLHPGRYRIMCKTYTIIIEFYWLIIEIILLLQAAASGARRFGNASEDL